MKWIIFLALLVGIASAGERWWLRVEVENGSWCNDTQPCVFYTQVSDDGSEKRCRATKARVDSTEGYSPTTRVCLPEAVMLSEMGHLASCHRCKYSTGFIR